LDEKKVLLAQAFEEEWVLVFEHDPSLVACRLSEDRGGIVSGDPVCLNCL
jgi:hypothetical protein